MDNNVTRHLPQELNQTDWNGMIVHYLGLDHIGHKSGPRRCAEITDTRLESLLIGKPTYVTQTDRNGQHCAADV